MKRIYIVLISLFLSLFSYADQITLETAKDAAISFINKKYQKKHHNNSIEDFGFSKNEIIKDFDFVYQEYSL